MKKAKKQRYNTFLGIALFTRLFAKNKNFGKIRRTWKLIIVIYGAKCYKAHALEKYRAASVEWNFSPALPTAPLLTTNLSLFRPTPGFFFLFFFLCSGCKKEKNEQKNLWRSKEGKKRRIVRGRDGMQHDVY